ncbi:MAG: hypothetical protein HY288_03950 [Planctomycetia bacterium]|nr:hypothetical protein [Planctomycetia bacterium]
MKRTFLALGGLLLVSVLATTMQASTSVPKRPHSLTDYKQPAGQHGESTNPHLEYLHNQYRRLATAGCHPSRAAVLAKTLGDSGANSANRPEVRKQLAGLVKHLSPVERKELQRFWLIEANYQKYQQQRAKKLPAMGGTDRPRDPWLDKLAHQHDERQQATSKSDR